jgi:sugar phosphate isomerase/epimerase
VLKVCQAAGVEGFEPRTTHAHGIEPSLSPGERAEVRQRFADAGVALWGLGSVCEFHSDDPAVVEKNIADCRTWVNLAHDLGARGVKVRPNGLRKDVPPEATYEQIGRALRECGKAASDAGVEIWVEVHGAETQKPAAMRAIMDHCGHKSVGACWNSNGTDRDENGSIRTAFDLLRPSILSSHIVDLWGDYPYRELFRLFRETGYDRFTLCEVSTAMDAAAGAAFLKCYRGLWKELQPTS